MFPHLDKNELKYRVLVGVVLTVLIAVPYAVAGRLEWRPVIWLTPGRFETWIPVDTWVAPWIYVSFYGLLYSAGLFLSRPVFRRCIIALAVTSVISVAFFLLLPSGVPRDEIDPDKASSLYRLLASVDAPRNAFPSEHASLGLIAVLALLRERLSWWIKGTSLVWLTVIYWSTIATRQHVFFDLVTGAALGALVWAWAGSKTGK